MPAASPTKITIDFSNVRDSGGPSAHVTPGDYLLEASGFEIKNSDKGPWKNVNWQFSIVGRPGEGTVYENTTLKEEGLFRLRDLLTAMGISVPKSKLAVDFAQLIGKQVGATLIDHTYEDKTTSKVGLFFSKSRLPAPGIVSSTTAMTTGTSGTVATSGALVNGHAAPETAAETVAEAIVVADESVEEMTFVDDNL